MIYMCISGHSLKSWMQNLENMKLLSEYSWSPAPPLHTDSSLLWPSKFNPVLTFPRHHETEMSHDIVSITADLSLDDNTSIKQFSHQNVTLFKPTNHFLRPIDYSIDDHFTDDFMEWEDESGVVNGYHNDNVNTNNMINKNISNTKNKSFIHPLVIIIVLIIIIIIIYSLLYYG